MVSCDINSPQLGGTIIYQDTLILHREKLHFYGVTKYLGEHVAPGSVTCVYLVLMHACWKVVIFERIKYIINVAQFYYIAM